MSGLRQYASGRHGWSYRTGGPELRYGNGYTWCCRVGVEYIVIESPTDLGFNGGEGDQARTTRILVDRDLSKFDLQSPTVTIVSSL